MGYKIIKLGIYKILNLITNDFYIGSAINLDMRKHRHFSQLKLNNHPNKHLQNAYNKYGIENFVFEILETIENKENLIRREQYYLDLFKPNYNIRKVAESNLGLKYNISEETRLKMANFMSKLHTGRKASSETKLKQSLWQINKKLSEEHKEKLREASTLTKEILMLDLSMNIIKEFKSITSASLELKCSISAICRALKDNKYKSMKHYWKYKNEF